MIMLFDISEIFFASSLLRQVTVYLTGKKEASDTSSGGDGQNVWSITKKGKTVKTCIFGNELHLGLNRQELGFLLLSI